MTNKFYQCFDKVKPFMVNSDLIQTLNKWLSQNLPYKVKIFKFIKTLAPLRIRIFVTSCMLSTCCPTGVYMPMSFRKICSFWVFTPGIQNHMFFARWFNSYVVFFHFSFIKLRHFEKVIRFEKDIPPVLMFIR